MKVYSEELLYKEDNIIVGIELDKGFYGDRMEGRVRVISVSEITASNLRSIWKNGVRYCDKYIIFIKHSGRIIAINHHKITLEEYTAEYGDNIYEFIDEMYETYIDKKGHEGIDKIWEKYNRIVEPATKLSNVIRVDGGGLDSDIIYLEG